MKLISVNFKKLKSVNSSTVAWLKVNGTNINWFHSWPKDALYDVAYSFLKDIEFPH